jgi:hypothetical protein
MTFQTTIIMERYAMNKGAGPTSARIPPEPTNRPVPIAPPRALYRGQLKKSKDYTSTDIDNDFICRRGTKNTTLINTYKN